MLRLLQQFREIRFVSTISFVIFCFSTISSWNLSFSVTSIKASSDNSIEVILRRHFYGLFISISMFLGCTGHRVQQKIRSWRTINVASSPTSSSRTWAWAWAWASSTSPTCSWTNRFTGNFQWYCTNKALILIMFPVLHPNTFVFCWQGINESTPDTSEIDQKNAAALAIIPQGI